MSKKPRGTEAERAPFWEKVRALPAASLEAGDLNGQPATAATLAHFGVQVTRLMVEAKKGRKQIASAARLVRRMARDARQLDAIQTAGGFTLPTGPDTAEAVQAFWKAATKLREAVAAAHGAIPPSAALGRKPDATDAAPSPAGLPAALAKIARGLGLPTTGQPLRDLAVSQSVEAVPAEQVEADEMRDKWAKVGRRVNLDIRGRNRKASRAKGGGGAVNRPACGRPRSERSRPR